MMPAVVRLFFSFDGRIGRRAWWSGFLAILFSGFAASAVADPAVWSADPPRAPAPALALVFLLLVVPMTAVSAKRFHDRGRSGWYGAALGGIGAGLILGEQGGFMLQPATASFLERGAFWLAVLLLSLGFIENGFLKGSPGPNRFGPDPQAPHLSGDL
jgi:uncharacterized membrane protein YhaH (DUF805 family)